MQFEIGSDSEIQANFDKFYEEMYILLDQFYQEREISVTSADPRFVTPIIRWMLRRKCRLMRSGRLDEANAHTKRVSDHPQRNVLGYVPVRSVHSRGMTLN